MFEVYNNSLCVYANDLIRKNAKRNVGSDNGFMAEGTYNYKVSRGLLVLKRRSSNGKPALIEYMTMEDSVKRQYITIYGDPTREAERTQMGLLESAMQYNESAYTYFSVEYRDELGRKLSAEKAYLYTLQARVLDAVLYLAGEKKREIGGGNTRIDVWGKLSDMVNELATIRNNQGEPRYPHKLPANAKSLKRKADQYAKEGWSALIHKNRGNRNAMKVTDERMEAVMHKLLSQHMNLNNVQIMEKYNEVATLMQMPVLKSPVTVDKYRKQMETTTLAHQRATQQAGNAGKALCTRNGSYLLDPRRLGCGTALPKASGKGWRQRGNPQAYYLRQPKDRGSGAGCLLQVPDRIRHRRPRMYRTDTNRPQKCRKTYQGIVRKPIQTFAVAERQLSEKEHDTVLPSHVEVLYTGFCRKCQIEDHRTLL